MFALHLSQLLRLGFATLDAAEFGAAQSRIRLIAAPPKLIKLLEENGFDPGCWQHPVFLCEKLASPSLMPIFLSPRDLARVWEKAGREAEELPKEVTVLDLRMLVSQMQTDVNPWSIFHIIASLEAMALAAELTGGAKPAEAAAAPKAEPASEDIEEDEEVLV